MLMLVVAMLAAQADAGTPQTLEARDAGSGLPFGLKLDARFGDGVTVGKDDFELTIRGRVQVLFSSQFPERNPDEDRFNSFEIRRARLLLTTRLPYHLSTYTQLSFANGDMEPDQPNVLRDFYVDWRRFRDVSVRLGQFKVPFDVQRQVSSSALQFVGRSFVTEELNLERDIGLAVFSDDLFGVGKRLKYSVAVMGGDGRNRIGTNPGLMFVGRVVIAPLGEFNEREEGDPEREKRVRFAIGGALARNNHTPRPRSTEADPYEFSTFSYTHATVDFHFKAYGFSLLAQGFLRDADRDFNVSEDGTRTEWSRSGLGWFVQGGAYVLDWLELVARYGDLRPFATTDPDFVREREMGGGINFMVKQHDLKLQLDYFWIDDGFFRAARHLFRAQAQVFF